MRRSLLLCSLALAALSGCSKSGIPDLGAKRDVAGDCSTPTSTWLRSTPDGVDVILLGSTDPTAVVAPGPVGTPSDTGHCFARGFIAHDSSTDLDVGTYDLDANGQGQVYIPVSFVFDYRTDQSILQRMGSYSVPHEPATVQQLAISKDGATLLVTVGAETHRYTNLYDVVHALDPTTQAGAEDVFRMFNLPLFVSQARLIGFGSGGMTMYVPSPGTFHGLVHNQFTVSVKDYLDPTTYISYTNFEDVTGIVVDGEQVSYPNLAGNGTMSGVISYRMYGSDSHTDIALSGSLDYGNLLISNGVAGGGTYTLNIDGVGSYTISYMLAADFDLRGVLPETTP